MTPETIIETRKCRLTGKEFAITDQDQEFYKKISPVFNGKRYLIPFPTLCPEARQQRRMAWSNERHLYRNTSSFSGKEIVSNYSPDKTFTLYTPTEWFSDHWDPLSYGRDIDFSRSFFSQYSELFRAVPRIALDQGFSMENSEYNNHADALKDCYMCLQAWECRDCLYLSYAYASDSCVDCTFCYNCDHCYNGYYLRGCFGVEHSRYVTDSRDSIYLDRCSGCENSLFCSGVDTARDSLLNEEVGKEKIAEVRGLIRQGKAESYYQQWSELVRNNTESRDIIAWENVSGRMIRESSNCHDVTLAVSSQNAKYCFNILWAHDVMDSTGYYLQHAYESYVCGGNSESSGAKGVLFSFSGWENVSGLIYCDYCMTNIHDCFLCIGLHSGQRYCILNKQYTKEEYETLVPQIIERMASNGEWGEFPPASMSPFGYNESVACEHFPLSKEEALKQGLQWSDYSAPTPRVEKVIPGDKLPHDIGSIPDDVLNWAIECEVSGKPFRIVGSELAFYRKRSLPLPRKHPDIRHLERIRTSHL